MRTKLALATICFSTINVVALAWIGNPIAAFCLWFASYVMLESEQNAQRFDAAVKLANECCDGWKEALDLVKLLKS